MSEMLPGSILLPGCPQQHAVHSSHCHHRGRAQWSVLVFLPSSFISTSDIFICFMFLWCWLLLLGGGGGGGQVDFIFFLNGFNKNCEMKLNTCLSVKRDTQTGVGG